MGSVGGTAVIGFSTSLGNALTAPFRTLFSISCEGVCAGTWDVVSFLEHFCVSSLARLFMVLMLTYIMLFFMYLMCKVGIIQCVAKNGCKMVAAACSACCRALGATSFFLWRKVRDTKHVHCGPQNRNNRDDIEVGNFALDSSDDDEEESSDDDQGQHGRSSRQGRARFGPSVRERRKERV